MMKALHGIMRSCPVWICSLLMLSNCANLKKDQPATAIDTTHQVVDTLHAQALLVESNIPEPEESSPGVMQNFPEFIAETSSDDSLEISINDEMAILLQAYDTIKYFSISANYSWTQEITTHGQEGDDTYVEDETKEENQTWLFDRFFKLRGFIREVKYDDEYGDGSESTIYLFSNDSLIAVSERTIDNSEVEEIRVTRILASRSPDVGFSRYMQYEYVRMEHLVKEDLISRQEKFMASMGELVNTLKEGKKNATEDDFYYEFKVDRTKAANPDKQAKAVVYSVTFNVEKDLYPNYIMKR
jgi:hypothetical protein